ncbi:MAG: tetratricopeptide repeat protein [Magnetococcales bacterium]|nr:tetratricopeptide repeat protein [Magnetococcales bacterium]
MSRSGYTRGVIPSARFSLWIGLLFAVLCAPGAQGLQAVAAEKGADSQTPVADSKTSEKPSDKRSDLSPSPKTAPASSNAALHPISAQAFSQIDLSMLWDQLAQAETYAGKQQWEKADARYEAAVETLQEVPLIRASLVPELLGRRAAMLIRMEGDHEQKRARHAVAKKVLALAFKDLSILDVRAAPSQFWVVSELAALTGEGHIERLGFDADTLGPLLSPMARKAARTTVNAVEAAEHIQLERGRNARLTQIIGEGHPMGVITLIQLGDAFRWAGSGNAAIKRYRTAMEQLRKLPLHNRLEGQLLAAAIQSRMADIRFKAGGYADAKALYTQNLAILTELWGEQDPRLIPTLNMLAAIAIHDDHHEEAGTLLYRALTLSRIHLGFEHPLTGVLALERADQTLIIGKYQEARPMYVEVLDRLARQEEIDRLAFIRILDGMARIRHEEGEYARALGDYRFALELLVEERGNEDPAVFSLRERYAAAIARLETPLSEEALRKRTLQGRIKEIQKRLNAMGLEAGPADGMVGKQTLNVLYRHLKQLGLPMPATIDDKSMDEVLRHLPPVKTPRSEETG